MAGQEKWVSLSVAAQRLGVHANTLRRWAEEGQVPYMLTPGGHRRFAVADLDALIEARRHVPAPSSVGTVWAETALTQTRSQLVGQESEPWLVAFDRDHRLEKRQMGRRLMGLILQYVNEDSNRDAILEEARAVGAAYGNNAQTMGMSVAMAIGAALFFRDSMLRAAFDIPDTMTIRPQEQRRLLDRLTEILNAVEMSVAAAYE